MLLIIKNYRESFVKCEKFAKKTKNYDLKMSDNAELIEYLIILRYKFDKISRTPLRKPLSFRFNKQYNYFSTLEYTNHHRE